MRTHYTLSVALWLVATAAAPASGQVQVQVHVATPTIRFAEPPPLVEVSPGVQVVQDYDEEVFFVDGWYWCRSGDVWYRTRDHRGGWVVVERRHVPGTIVRIKPGHYRHFHPHEGDRGRVKVREHGDREVVRVKVKEEGHHGHEGHQGNENNEGRGRGHGRWR